MAITDTSALPPKTRIVATTSLPGVPEGTTGKLGRSVGLTLTRYRVAFDNGVDLTSVTHTDLVREDEWDEFLAQRDAEEAAAAAGEPTPSDSTPAPEGDAGESGAAAPADDRLAALLAKSKAAKAKKMGTPEDQADAPAEEPAAAEPEAPASPADDRLAALLAKSKAAKEKKLAEG